MGPQPAASKTHRTDATRRARAGLFGVCGALALAAPGGIPRAEAQTRAPETSETRPALTPRVRDEARRRFDRGLALYDSGDLIGALVEFQRAHELTGHPVVLYNLALVHAALGDAASAVAALEKLRAAGMSELGPERAARAEQVFQEQLRRVGELEVKVNVERASIQLNNVDVATTPTQPLRVTAGTHLLSVLAPGHEPRRLNVSVPGNARQVVEVELKPLEQALARLTLTTNVPDVQVTAGGDPVGRTPFAANLAFKPGTHDLLLERQGYVPVRRQVTLHAGSEGELDIELTPSEAGLAAGGTLKLALSEDNAVVSIDGQPGLDHAGGIPLPLGRHSLLIERKGFFPVKREVVVTPGTQTMNITLLPTAEHLGDYVARTEAQRTWSYIALGAGSLVTLGSGGFLLWNYGQKQDAETAFDDFASQAERDRQQGESCDDTCEETLNILLDDLDQKRQRDVYGWVGVGVGAAALGTGALLYLLGDDPERYDPKPESDVFGSLRLQVGAGSAGVSGTF